MDTLATVQGPARERGFVLVLALVILIIITLSSVAMISSLRGGISASGNIAFRQAATRAADVAVDGAFQWVQTNMATAGALDGNLAASGAPRYYATMSAADSGCKKDGAAGSFSPQMYRFSDTVTGSDGFPCAALVASSPAGYTLYYVVHRMANATGACPTPAGCLAPSIVSATSSSAGCSMDPTSASFCGASATTTNTLVYYRITIKVVGPRQNNRYIQAFVY